MGRQYIQESLTVPQTLRLEGDLPGTRLNSNYQIIASLSASKKVQVSQPYQVYTGPKHRHSLETFREKWGGGSGAASSEMLLVQATREARKITNSIETERNSGINCASLIMPTDGHCLAELQSGS